MAACAQERTGDFEFLARWEPSPMQALNLTLSKLHCDPACMCRINRTYQGNTFLQLCPRCPERGVHRKYRALLAVRGLILVEHRSLEPYNGKWTVSVAGILRLK